MNKNIITGVVIAIVFLAIGLIIRPWIFPDRQEINTVKNITGTTDIKYPDTVKIYMADSATIQENEDLKKALARKPKTIVVYDTIYPVIKSGAVGDEEVETFGVKFIKSQIDLRYDAELRILKNEDPDYMLRNQIWAYSKSAVDSFSIKPEIRWNNYYEKNIAPKVNQQKSKNLFQGAVGSAVIAGGLFLDKWYYAVPAIGTGAALIMDWISLPFN